MTSPHLRKPFFVFCISLFTFILVFSLPPHKALAEEGNSNGGNVSPYYGSFSTEVPIAVPAYHGLEPKLKLVYNSTEGQNQSKSGYLTLAILALAIVGLSFLLIAVPKIGSFKRLEDIEQPQEKSRLSSKAIESDTPEAILDRAENQLDPKAVNQAKLTEAKEKIDKIRGHEDVEPPPPAPLSSMAPPQPQAREIQYEPPSERLKKLSKDTKDTSSRQAKNTTLPNAMDIENPPTWNETLNEPAPPAEVPDPFIAPPMKIDPKRVQ